MIASVVLPLPIDRPFSYSVPAGLQDEIAVGKRVRIRFNDRERWGIVISISEGEDDQLEPIIAVRPYPCFSEDTLAFSEYVCGRYLAPLGILVNRILPASVNPRSDRTLALAADLASATSHIERTARRAPKQAAILRELLSSPDPLSESTLRKRMGTIRKPIERLIELGLIREVRDPWSPTGSATIPAGMSKTGRVLLLGEDRIDTYARLIASFSGGDRGMLIIAPEILAAEALHRSLSARLGGDIDLYHSGLSEGKRGSVWERARTGEARLIVGTRSALFLPLDRPELVIVDEEQDRSYKQSDALPYYHGRDIAVQKGRFGLVVLGSAAPSLETYHEGVNGGIGVHRSTDRPVDRTWRIIDHTGEEGIGPQLADEIRSTLERGMHALIGTGRAGYYPTVVCRSCHRPLRCRSCGTNLTYSPTSPRLICPTCGATESPRCEHCGDTRVEFIGSGSARIEAEIKGLFPTARILRIDADSIRGRGDYRHLLSEIDAADIVIGTPMIAKGPRLARVGLAASVDVDRLLAAPDFRANERAYQYLIGLASRIGEGRVIVQTARPDHPVITAASAGDYAAFYAKEIEERRAFFYPPFSRLARITLIEPDPGRRQAAVARIEKVCAAAPIEILGPVPHPRRPGGVNIILKAASADLLRETCIKIAKLGLRAQIDIDPDRL